MSSEWVCETSPRPKKLKFQRSRIKTMLIIFFNSQGIVHKEFVPDGKTLSREFYKGLPPEAHSAGLSCCVLLSTFFLVARQRARPRSCKCLPIFYSKNVTTLQLPPQYSPDLSAPDYCLFPKLKMKRTPPGGCS